MTEQSVVTQQENQVMQIVCFYLGNEEFGLGIDQIQEVIRLGSISPMPQMPAFCLGLMNMRGRVGSVFDLREVLGVDKKEFDDNTRVLDIDIQGVTVGLIVDKVLENIKLETKKIDPPPSVKMVVSKDCILGIGDHSGRLITILNLEQIYLYISQNMKAFAGKEKNYA